MKRKNIGHWKIKEEMRNMHYKEKKLAVGINSSKDSILHLNW